MHHWTLYNNIVKKREKKNSFLKEDFITIPQEARWEKEKIKTKNVNKLLKNIPMDTIIELKKLIYARVKLINDKIGILSWDLKINTKPERGNKLKRTKKKH